MNNKMIKILLYLCIVFLINNSYFFEAKATISAQCQNDMNEVLQFTYPNATEMVEYCGLKMNDLGNVDGCLQLPSSVSQYCIYQNTLMVGDYPDNYYVGVCYPASCSVEDVINLVPTYSLSPGGEVPMVHCYNSSDYISSNRPVNNVSIGIFIFAGIVILLIIIGTTIDYLFYNCNSTSQQKKVSYNKSPSSYEEVSLLSNQSINEGASYDQMEHPIFKSKPAVWVQFLLGFSFIKNFKSFITVYPNGVNVIKENNDGSSEKRVYFDSLDGIRTLSMCWVVLGHSLLFNSMVGYDNLQELFTAYQGFAFQIIPAGEFAVDMFFMLSGFLVCNSVMKQLDKKPELIKSIKFWALYIVHRFIRLSPLYYFLILCYVYLAPLLFYGPFVYLYKLDVIIPSCQNNLLPNFLYYNNLENNNLGECYPVSWYLGNDFQFYIVAIAIFILYKYRKSFSWIFMSLLVVFCIVFNIAVSYKYKIQPFFSMSSGSSATNNVFLTDIYEKPWFRIGPYIVGMMASFLFLEYPQKIQRIYKIKSVRYFIYFLSFSITFILTFTPNSYYKGNGWNTTQTSLWNGFAHTVFPTAVIGFMYASFFGYGGVLKYFLELPIFKVLTKLTYSVYLTHQLIVYIRVMSTTQLFHYSWIEYTYTFFGNLFGSMFVAFVLHLTIEKPFINIERLIFGGAGNDK